MPRRYTFEGVNLGITGGEESDGYTFVTLSEQEAAAFDRRLPMTPIRVETVSDRYERPTADPIVTAIGKLADSKR